MKRPQNIRAPPKAWVKVLQVAYPFLRETEMIGDLALFGSQALSVYMRNPLRSKDLDLLSAQVSPPQVERLAEELGTMKGMEIRTTTTLTRTFGPRKMTTHAIELRVDGRPFFVELFDLILDGQPPSILQPYVEMIRRWKLEIWTPNLEATIALRLAFRQPEGISRFNATRLNDFINENRGSIRFNRVASILQEWGLEDWVEKNLLDLQQRNKLRIIGDSRIIPGIQKKLK